VSEQNQQPPAQVVGVEGFESTKRMGDNIDWPRLCRLPPFQMFVEEHAPNALGVPADRYAMRYTAEQCTAKGGEAFYAEYVAWHGAKGHWPHETPDGRPR